MPISDHGTSRLNYIASRKSRALKVVCAILGGMALAAMTAACGLGGPGGGPEIEQARKAEQMADDMVNKLDKKVPLTFAKIAKVRAIFLEHFKKRQGRGPGGESGGGPGGDRGGPGGGPGGGPPPGMSAKGDKDDKSDKKMAPRDDLLELELSLVLNEKEMAAYKELMREERDKMKKRRPKDGEGGPGPGGPRPSGS